MNAQFFINEIGCKFNLRKPKSEKPTWCGGCIRKLPYFMKVREKYKDRKDVEFITVSIDASGSFEKWKEHMKKHNLTDAINLIAFADKNSFQDDYGIMGIPMYYIIGKDGKFLYSDVPGPGDGRAVFD